MAALHDLIDGAAMSIDLPMSTRPRSASRASRWAFATASLLAVPALAAGEFSVGFAGGASQGRDDCVASFACDRSSSFGKLFASYRANDAVDIQAIYFGAARFRGGDTSPLGTEFGGTFRVDGFGLTAGGTWNFAPSWSLGAGAGIAAVHTRFDYQNTVWGSVSKTTAQPMLGLGLTYAVTPSIRVGVDYDLTRFKVYRTRGPLQMLGVAAQFSF
jgi:hypothetical protein